MKTNIKILSLLFFSASLFLHDQVMGIVLTVPEADFFQINQNSRQTGSSGFLGIALEYRLQYGENSFIAVKIGVLTDFFLPVPAAYDPPFTVPGYSGTIKAAGGWFFRIENQNELNGIIKVGYGIQMSGLVIITNVFVNGTLLEEKSVSLKASGLGPSLSLASDFDNGFYMSIQYLPNFIFFPWNQAQYSHLAFFDLGWEWQF